MKIKAEGWLARIFQHEIDHVNGVVFPDRAARVWKPEPDEVEDCVRCPPCAVSRGRTCRDLGSSGGEHWLGEEMIVHGDVYLPEQVEGFVNEDWKGLVTYRIEGQGCEILSLDSLKEGMGTGTALIRAVAQEPCKIGWVGLPEVRCTVRLLLMATVSV